MKKLLSLALISLAMFAFEAAAATQTMNINWSGASFGNSASATGHITFDDNAVGDGISSTGNWLAVTDFGMTIAGASSGNGSFGLSDFSWMYFWTPSTLDFTKELIGQPLTNGSTFGNTGGGIGGDFNIFASTVGAPSGTWYFTLTTNGGAGDQMLVTSIAPSSVPVPAAVWLFGTGIAGLMGMGKRRQLQASAG